MDTSAPRRRQTPATPLFDSFARRIRQTRSKIQVLVNQAIASPYETQIAMQLRPSNSTQSVNKLTINNVGHAIYVLSHHVVKCLIYLKEKEEESESSCEKPPMSPPSLLTFAAEQCIPHFQSAGLMSSNYSDSDSHDSDIDDEGSSNNGGGSQFLPESLIYENYIPEHLTAKVLLFHVVRLVQSISHKIKFPILYATLVELASSDNRLARVAWEFMVSFWNCPNLVRSCSVFKWGFETSSKIGRSFMFLNLVASQYFLRGGQECCSEWLAQSYSSIYEDGLPEISRNSYFEFVMERVGRDGENDLSFLVTKGALRDSNDFIHAIHAFATSTTISESLRTYIQSIKKSFHHDKYLMMLMSCKHNGGVHCSCGSGLMEWTSSMARSLFETALAAQQKHQNQSNFAKAYSSISLDVYVYAAIFGVTYYFRRCAMLKISFSPEMLAILDIVSRITASSAQLGGFLRNFSNHSLEQFYLAILCLKDLPEGIYLARRLLQELNLSVAERKLSEQFSDNDFVFMKESGRLMTDIETKLATAAVNVRLDPFVDDWVLKTPCVAIKRSASNTNKTICENLPNAPSFELHMGDDMNEESPEQLSSFSQVAIEIDFEDPSVPMKCRSASYDGSAFGDDDRTQDGPVKRLPERTWSGSQTSSDSEYTASCQSDSETATMSDASSCQTRKSDDEYVHAHRKWRPPRMFVVLEADPLPTTETEDILQLVQ